MESFERAGTEKTPYVCMHECGRMEFKGASLPEDSAKYYFKIMDWISDYYRAPSPQTNLTVVFTYLNSASSSMMFKIFHTLNRLHNTGKTEIRCTWHYDSEDVSMKEFIDYVRRYCPDIKIDSKEEESLMYLL